MIKRLPRTATTSTALLVLLLASLPRAQGTSPAGPLTLVAPEGRRTVPTTVSNNQELVSLDELVTLFQLTVREDSLAGGLTIAYRGRTIVVSPGQSLASVNGRVVALPSPIVRSGNRWLVPVEFISRALVPIYDRRIDLRRASRLLVVGDVRVPRVVARVDAAGPPSRGTIEITPTASVSTDVSESRVLFRIDADALDLALPSSGGGLIEQIRAGDQQNSVSFVLSAAAGTPKVTTSTADNITRVTIEVPSRVAAPPESSASAPKPPLPAPPLAVAQGVLQTIVIDPGHGGEDLGARGAGGTEEKRITLEVARRVKGLVESRLGIRVVLTREEDRTTSLDERAAIANNSKADLFLSLHVNAAPAPSATGVEIFHMQLDREGEDARRDIDTQAVTLPVLGGGTRKIEIIEWDMAQAGHVEASAMLATLLEETLRGRVMMSPRPIQQALLRVLTGVNMPAALIEMGFISNPGQEKLVAADPYQTSIAQAIYETIVRFRLYLEGRPDQ